MASDPIGARAIEEIAMSWNVPTGEVLKHFVRTEFITLERAAQLKKSIEENVKAKTCSEGPGES